MTLPSANPPAPAPTAGSLFQRRIIAPLLHLLSIGATPTQLSWSLAVGFAIGINPLLGSTTVACLLIAFVFRLNLVASQIANHLVYPLQLALCFVFLRAGEVVFHTPPLPLAREALLHALRHHPLATTRMLWMWEWHALIVWLGVISITTPLIAAVLTPALRRLLHSICEHPAQPELIAR